jgi:hypothetical protein
MMLLANISYGSYTAIFGVLCGSPYTFFVSDMSFLSSFLMSGMENGAP